MEEKEFNELVAKIEKTTGEKIESQVKEALKDMPDFNAIKELLEKDFADASAVQELKEILEAQGEAITKIETKGQPGAGKTLEDEIKENKEALKAISKRQGNKSVVLKALTTRASVATNNIGLDLPGLGEYGLRKARSFYNFIQKQIIPLPQDHAGVIRYRDWDEATTAKAAAAVAEGAAFPESTAAWAGFTLPVEKIGDTLPVTEEFFEDEPSAAAELSLFLSNNVEDKVANDVILGNGTSPNIFGLDARATAYTAPDLNIVDANIKDLVVKVVEDITTNYGSKYSPDFVAMNIADYNEYVLKKDSQNRYLFDDNGMIGGLNVVIDNHVAANTMYVGDSRYCRLYEVPGVEVSQGMVNAQFNEDEFTIKARKRLAFLIRNNDRTGFRKVASISAALTTLAPLL